MFATVKDGIVQQIMKNEQYISVENRNIYDSTTLPGKKYFIIFHCMFPSLPAYSDVIKIIARHNKLSNYSYVKVKHLKTLHYAAFSFEKN